MSIPVQNSTFFSSTKRDFNMYLEFRAMVFYVYSVYCVSLHWEVKLDRILYLMICFCG